MTLIAMILGGLVIYLGYNFYARRIDRDVIQADARKATPATMYMDGVDFVPASRNVLYGYHFKSIAAAGPIVGAITAANIWGWLPSILWLFLGVMFIGSASDYSAIMVSVRNDGNSISAIAHRLIAPRTRTILLTFIFFYLLLVAGAFGNLVADVLNRQPQVPLAIIALMVMGLLGGQMVQGFNGAINAVSGGGPFYGYYDPTLPPAQGQQPGGVVLNNVNVTPSFIFWLLFLCLFSYLGAALPIWRYAQPVNYIGFWLTFITIVLAFLGAAFAVVLSPEVATFKLGAVNPQRPDLGFGMAAGQ